MDPEAIALFREVADLSLPEREAYFAERGVPASLRHEVESLLRFDDEANDSLHEQVAAAAGGLVFRAHQFQRGMHVGPYTLRRELGRGGMGTVWIANRTDGALKRPIALKLLRWDLVEPQFTARFSRERDILAALAHPNIARLYDAGVTSAGQPYLALEYVEGEPLTAYAATHRLGLRERIRLFLQIADAVHYAHRNLVIHRDLKPGNVLVSADGIAHLLDFGIAKLLTDHQSAAIVTELTQQGDRLLTLEYASPEQISGTALTTATDVYSLGVILCELLAGHRPYRLQRGSRAELEEAIVSAEPSAPSRVAAEPKLATLLRGDLDTIVLKALRKDPAERYSTADGLARDLRRFLDGEPVEARPQTRLYQLTRFVQRHKAGVGVAAVVIAAMLSSLVFAVVQMREARAQRDAAVFEARRAEASLQLAGFLVGEARVRPGDRSVADRLAKSRELVRRQFASQPAIRAELLFEIADKQAELRDLATLNEVMAEIGVLAQETDLPWLQARYRCATAELKMNEGDTEVAATLMREAFLQLARERPQQFGATVECLIVDAFLASLAGDFQRAAQRGHEATRLHEERGLQNTNSYADAWSALVTAFSFSGDVRSALDAVRRQRETYERLGQDDTFSYLTTLFMEATFLNRGGRRMEALQRSDRVLEESMARGVPDNHTQLAYRGIILLGVGRPQEALQLFDAAAEAFAAQKMQFDELQMHIWATEALLQLGNVAAARIRLDRVWPSIETHIEARNASMTKGLRVLARVLAAEHRLTEARAAVDRAVAIVDAANSPTYTGAAAIFLTAADLALVNGDAPRALSEVERALERATRDAIDPQQSADVGEILLARARALQAQGRSTQAEADEVAAQSHFRATLPADHPMRQLTAATVR